MLFRNLKWNVVGWFRTVSLISYAVIALGIAAMLYHVATTPNHEPLRLGLSFTGGTDITVKFKDSVSKEQLVSAFAGLGAQDARITPLGKPGDTGTPRWSIETQDDFGNRSPQLWAALNRIDAVDRAQSTVETVGPSLGREYLLNALIALVIAIVIQFGYIAFRFGWNYIFGLVTVIALVRDAAMMIGIYALADKRVDDAFLAAVLTVIGYSVMDTIVILDRIRENVKVMDGQPFDRIVNTSILQTMTRSVNTLATVVITLVALLAFGGASLQNFGFALLVGICSGGYHSIFYSAPLVSVLQKRQRESAARRGARSDLQPARNVAEARAQASGKDRAEIIAARKARRERERTQVTRATGPVRYRRRRDASGTMVETTEEMTEAEALQDEYEIDPLDAQQLGLHDDAGELGHEEIRLNLEDEHVPAEHGEHLATPDEHVTHERVPGPPPAP